VSTPTLVAVCGLPGAGKTTVAERIADRREARLLRTDVVRTDLFPDPEYTDEEAEAVYAELFERATAALDDGDVVLDATFRTEAFRAGARTAAADVGAEFILVAVECDDETVRRRLRARTDDESDADIAVYELFRDTYEPVTDPDLVVDNSGSLEETFAQLGDAV
jgi:predicted kinase